MSGPVQGQITILVEIASDQFGQARRGQNTGGDPGGEGLARTGQHRHARPEDVGGGGMGIVGRRIQEKIGKGDTGQMLVLGDMVGEKDTFLTNTQPESLLLEMGPRGWPWGK